MGLVKGALDEVPKADRTKLITAASASAEHMSGLVNHIMDLSKLRAGELVLPLHVDCFLGFMPPAKYGLARVWGSVFLTIGNPCFRRAPFALAPLCQEVVDAMRDVYAHRVSVTFVDGGDGGGTMVIGSRIHLKQILTNLCMNGLKATSKHWAGREGGAVELAVSALPCDDGGHGGGDSEQPARKAFRFLVRDNGPGIAPQAQSSVFTKYAQAGNLKAGTGLGLPISQSLVELMGGRIEVTSPWCEFGSGAQFDFTIAFDDGGSEQAANDAASARAAALRASTGRLLIADDDPMNILVMRTLLKDLVPLWDVVDASSGTEAVALFCEALRKGKTPFHAVFLDEDFGFDPATMQMRKSGTDATKEMRAAILDAREKEEDVEEGKGGEGTQRRRPLIVGCTGSDTTEHAAKAVAAGQDGVLSKPYSTDAIAEVLQSLV